MLWASEIALNSLSKLTVKLNPALALVLIGIPPYLIFEMVLHHSLVATPWDWQPSVSKTHYPEYCLQRDLTLFNPIAVHESSRELSVKGSGSANAKTGRMRLCLVVALNIAQHLHNVSQMRYFVPRKWWPCAKCTGQIICTFPTMCLSTTWKSNGLDLFPYCGIAHRINTFKKSLEG